MLLYGAGGHARVISSIIRACGEEVSFVFDDDTSKKLFSGIPVLNEYDPQLLFPELIIIAIGNNLIRRKISLYISHDFGILIHPSACVDTSVSVRSGTVVMHSSVIQAGTSVGKHAIINTGAIIDHDCRITDFVHIAPGVTVCGNVSIGENTIIGAGSTIVPNLTIGKNCTVAAGSVVTLNIPDGALVRGNPARIIKN
jgi:sugar O-acyltransferase (sialic acid O-acetyltransferase NeuD family)